MQKLPLIVICTCEVRQVFAFSCRNQVKLATHKMRRFNIAGRGKRNGSRMKVQASTPEIGNTMGI